MWVSKEQINAIKEEMNRIEEALHKHDDEIKALKRANNFIQFSDKHIFGVSFSYQEILKAILKHLKLEPVTRASDIKLINKKNDE